MYVGTLYTRVYLLVFDLNVPASRTHVLVVNVFGDFLCLRYIVIYSVCVSDSLSTSIKILGTCRTFVCVAGHTVEFN